MRRNRLSSKKKVIYLDTSGLNYLENNIKDFDNFSLLKKDLNFELFLSPITLWEIFLNGNEERRDELIYWAQFNCAPNLLKSPTELILNYIKLNCPSRDRRAFYKSPYTDMNLGVTWKDIYRKIEKTIPININELKDRTEPMRMLSKKLKTIILDMCDENKTNKCNDSFHIVMLRVSKSLNYDESVIVENEELLKIALIFLFFTICIGIEFENYLIRDYWSKLKIEDPFDRLDYLVDTYPLLLNRGPIMEMARTAEIQLKMSNSKSRGLYHDCFHAIYCYYTDSFITSDEHFKSLRENENDTIFSRIIMTEEVELIWGKL